MPRAWGQAPVEVTPQRQLAAAIEEVFPGSSVALVNHAVVGMVVHRGLRYGMRACLAPTALIELGVSGLDGFRLAIAWGGRRFGAELTGVEAIDVGYRLRTNDLALAKVWLDEACQQVLLGQHIRARTLATILSNAKTHPAGKRAATAARPWSLELAGGVLRARGPEGVAHENAIAALTYACVVAGRPARWAASCAAMAPDLGGARVHLADRVELGRSAMVVDAGGVEIDISYQRRGGFGRTGLRTRVATLLSADAAVSVSELAVRYPRLWLTLRESALAAWFEGAVLDAAVLQPAVTALAEVARAAGPGRGPYR